MDTPASQNPFASQPPAPPSIPTQPSSVGGLDYFDIQALCIRAGWLKFMGVLCIIGGVMYCITIIGIIFGWLPIWIGLLLCKASNNLESDTKLRIVTIFA